VHRDSLVAGASLYSVDAELLEAPQPDLIIFITQDLCAVCAVSSGELADACPAGTTMLSLDPRTLGEVAESVRNSHWPSTASTAESSSPKETVRH
jgi:hypothetical protein